jgi:5-formyltetrahydrofolate cyclo-ligase
MLHRHYRDHSGKITAMSLEPTKQQWREELLELRNVERSLGDDQAIATAASQLVADLGVTEVASYVAMPGEPSLAAFNAQMASQGRLALPVVDGDNLRWRRPDTLIEGPFGTKSPTGPEVSQSALELVFVPALAVDSHGFRLGRGGGFYDRAFEALSSRERDRGDRPLLVAVINHRELVDSLPSDAHDVRMHAVITERKTRWFI